MVTDNNIKLDVDGIFSSHWLVDEWHLFNNKLRLEFFF